jgi:predicted hydrocarbon binding protein
MHGIIFAELKKFAEAALGPEAWPRMLADAGLGRVSYLATETYPDADLVALVEAAVRRSGIAAPQLLEQFGAFIVPDLLKVFGAFVKREWTALDLLENTESVIHRAVRLADAKATPPQLRITRSSPSQVTIEYSSQRRLCAVAKGLISGIAAHYREPLTIIETTCMHTGGRVCTFVATRS